MISVFGNLLQIMKFWVNIKSAILKCRAVIPKAVIGKPSTVFNLGVIGCMGVLKIVNMLICGISKR